MPIGTVEAGRLVYFHNHGNPGPGLYFPERWTHNRAHFTPRGSTVPPDFDAVRAWLSPTLTPWAWAMVPAALVTTGIGWWLYRVLARRELLARRPGLTPEQARAKAELEALMLASSAPQVPAVAATMLYMLGADAVPVAAAMITATLGVVSLGVALERGVPQVVTPPDDASEREDPR